jgi:hypothetical protein
VFGVLAYPAVRACLGRMSDDPALRLVPATSVVLVAVAAYLAGKVPLGVGSADLLVLPAIVVLLASGLQRIAGRIGPRFSRRTLARAATASGAVAVVGALAFAWTQRSWYPSQNLEALSLEIAAHSQPDDVVIVSARNTNSWAFDGLSPFHVELSGPRDRSSGIGYSVVFDSGHVLTQQSPSSWAIPGMTSLPVSDKRLWLVGTTLLNASPSLAHPTEKLAATPLQTSAPLLLALAGWRATGTTVRAPGVFATLYERT